MKNGNSLTIFVSLILLIIISTHPTDLYADNDYGKIDLAYVYFPGYEGSRKNVMNIWVDDIVFNTDPTVQRILEKQFGGSLDSLELKFSTLQNYMIKDFNNNSNAEIEIETQYIPDESYTKRNGNLTDSPIFGDSPNSHTSTYLVSEKGDYKIINKANTNNSPQEIIITKLTDYMNKILAMYDKLPESKIQVDDNWNNSVNIDDTIQIQNIEASVEVNLEIENTLKAVSLFDFYIASQISGTVSVHSDMNQVKISLEIEITDGSQEKIIRFINGYTVMLKRELFGEMLLNLGEGIAGTIEITADFSLESSRYNVK
jgi:hypothetical protein